MALPHVLARQPLSCPVPGTPFIQVEHLGQTWAGEEGEPLAAEEAACGDRAPSTGARHCPGTAPPSWAAPLGARFPSCAVVAMALVCTPSIW